MADGSLPPTATGTLLEANEAPALPTQPADAASRLQAGLERLQCLHDEMATRHALLSTGMSRLEGLRQTMIAQLDAITGDADLEPSLGFPELRLPNWQLGYFPHERTALTQDPGATDDREQAEDDEPNLGWESHGAQLSLGAGAHDQEPALGWPDRMNQVPHRRSTTDYEDEPALGAPERHPNVPSGGFIDFSSREPSQEDWAQGAHDDREDEHDGREPDVEDEPWLGSLDGARHLVVTAREPDGRATASELTDPLDQTRWATAGGLSDLEEQCEDEGGQCDDEGNDGGDREPDDWGWEAPDNGTRYPSASGVWPPPGE